MRNRAPADQELAHLVEAYVRDEVFYREGLALGLDRDDPVVRNRVRQKAEILSHDALSVEPADADLQAYLDAHRELFDIPAPITFDQVYFDPARHADGLTAALDAARRDLARGTRPDEVGDRTLLPRTLTRAMPADIAAAFGDAFAASVAKLEDHTWQGPIATSYGVHLVRITSRGEARRATLAEARNVVAREWSRARSVELQEQFYRSLRARYTVTIATGSDLMAAR